MRLYMGKEISEDTLAAMVRAYKAGRDIPPEEVEGTEDPNQVQEEDNAIIEEMEAAGVDPLRIEFARELGAKAGGHKDDDEGESLKIKRKSTRKKIEDDQALNREGRDA